MKYFFGKPKINMNRKYTIINNKNFYKPTGLSLADFPELIPQIHPTLNGCSVDPALVSCSSGQKLFWLCSKAHSWEAVISSRTQLKHGCPFCSGQRACLDNSLGDKVPYLILDWHTEKNLPRTPWNTTCGSNYTAHWICHLCKHEWTTKVHKRGKKGQQCPKCFQSISFSELFVYSHMKYILPEAEHGVTLGKIKIDMLDINLGIAIEVDGFPWRKEKEERDRKKTEILLKDYNIVVFRFRDDRLESLDNRCVRTSIQNIDIHKPELVDKRDLNKLFTLIGEFVKEKYSQDISSTVNNRIADFVTKTDNINTELYLQLKNRALLRRPKNNLSLRPDIVKNWDFKKNNPLQPENISLGSNRTVAWICECGWEWSATVKHRVQGFSVCWNCSPAHKASRISDLTNKEVMAELYILKLMSTDAIGERYGVNKNTINSKLKKLGIPMRRGGKKKKEQQIYTDLESINLVQ